MIYVDSSVALAHVFGEDPPPPKALWTEALCSSRLLEYEMWNRVDARGLRASHEFETRALLANVRLVEMTPQILVRALHPFPIAPRTLDALHLATACHVRSQGQTTRVASYDKRMRAAARALGFTLFPL